MSSTVLSTALIEAAEMREYEQAVADFVERDLISLKGETLKYAVVTWYNYRKELHADFMEYFNDYESARIFALNLAKKEMDTSKLNMEEKMFIESQTDETSMLSDETQEKIKELEEKTEECYTIITEGEITDDYGGPYDTLIGYACSHSGYSSEFYCVVDSFPGVENSWNQWDNFEDDSEWIPRYSN